VAQCHVALPRRKGIPDRMVENFVIHGDGMAGIAGTVSPNFALPPSSCVHAAAWGFCGIASAPANRIVRSVSYI
jgi:hypothetical protein